MAAKFGSRRYLQLLQEVRANKELANYYKEELKLAANAPDYIVDWSIEYGISIACFKCHEHDEYFVTLDNIFPYDWADCQCVNCVKIDYFKN